MSKEDLRKIHVTMEDFIEELKELLILDYDAVEAYEAAISRLHNTNYRQKFEEFKNDHLDHIEATTKFLEKENYKIPQGPGLKSILTRGKVLLGNLAGDTAILVAMRSNERETTSSYSKINKYDCIPEELKPSLVKGFEDETKHLAWIEKKLQPN